MGLFLLDTEVGQEAKSKPRNWWLWECRAMLTLLALIALTWLSDRGHSLDHGKRLESYMAALLLNLLRSIRERVAMAGAVGVEWGRASREILGNVIQESCLSPWLMLLMR